MAATQHLGVGDAFAAPIDMGGHTINNVTDPLTAQQAATKNYVDTTVQGLQPKGSVAAATTAALPANTYNNGAAGVGATLTATGTGALPTIDGYTPVAGDKLLIKNEATAANNGIYSVTQVGDGTHPYILTRVTNFDSPAEIAGSWLFVLNGTANVNRGWIVDSSGPYTIGTTAITFTQFLGAVLQKVSANIGDGSTTALTFTHNLATADHITQVVDASGNIVYPDVLKGTNADTITFATAPATNAYRCTAIG